MGRLSYVGSLFMLELGALSSLLSCGLARPPQRLTLKVDPAFGGIVHISTCVQSAPAAEITADSQGAAATSICPTSDQALELVVVRGAQSYRIAQQDVSIQRTGDGIPTSIQAQVRP